MEMIKYVFGYVCIAALMIIMALISIGGLLISQNKR